MKNELLISGFGGQGVMLSGQLLGYAATYAGKNATFYPTYGAEQRGGTANCTVVISDEEIASPVSDYLDVLIAMNTASLRKFEKDVKPGGTIIINQSLVNSDTQRKDVFFVKIPANDIAKDLGSIKVANMAMLGAYIGITKILTIDELSKTIEKKLGRKPELLTMNLKAIIEGMKIMGGS